MSSDLALVAGVLCLFLMLPAAVSDFAASRPPWGAIVLFAIGGGLITLAMATSPVAYQITDLPVVVMRVIGRLIH
ncbi:MAG: hypothetical protein JSR87_05710 [Proteobacteria bacterium]|nr:hypothetical protein [Pseudomonadota bacterium]MBS0574185.1 hypothetical protein [Pseudomonadota bacterium]